MQDGIKVPQAFENQKATPMEGGGSADGSIFSQSMSAMMFSPTDQASKEKRAADSEKIDLQTQESQLNTSKAKDEKAEEQAERKHDFPISIILSLTSLDRLKLFSVCSFSKCFKNTIY